jgi:hypothetical protein
MKDVKAGLAMNEGLAHEEVDGKTYWFVDGKLPKLPQGPRAHLLQLYDEYFVSYKDRSAVMDPRLGGLEDKRWMWVAPFIVDGRAAGSWQRDQIGRVRKIGFKYRRKLSSEEQGALDDAVQRYGDYLGTPVVAAGR